MKKKKWIMAAAGALAVVGMVTAIRWFDSHKYDDYLNQPGDTVQKCIETLNLGSTVYPEEASLFTYMKNRRNKISEEPGELIRMYTYNRLLKGTGSFDSYEQILEDTLWHLRDCSFSDPQMIIPEKDGEVYYKVTAKDEETNRDLWLRLNQAGNGKWYISKFTDIYPDDWNGNAPLTENNKEWGEKFINTASDADICRMFSLVSASQLNSDDWNRGFSSPHQLPWEDFLCFYFASLSTEERNEAYNDETKCYRFTREQIGRRVWQYLGSDDYDRSALAPYGFPHGGMQTLAEYAAEDGEEEVEEGEEVYDFPEQLVSEIKTFDTSYMTVTNKEVLDNGKVLLEIDYRNDGKEPQQINHQTLELRVLEQGYRYLSYSIIDQEHASEANRILEDFAWREWNLVTANHCTYKDGVEEPEITGNRLPSDYQDARDIVTSMALGEVIPYEELPDSARIIDALIIEAVSGDHKRNLEMYSIDNDGQSLLLLRTYNVDLVVGGNGGGGGGISFSINGNSISQAISGEKYVLCIYEDAPKFQAAVQKLIENK